jgi:hypothetical protein
MRLSDLVIVPAALLLWADATPAADLSKIDRTIQKEPAYQSKPRYCLLVFGPEAKHRVWLVVDGDVLYVDKNGTGDLTEEGKRINAPGFTASTHPAHAQERSIEVGDLSVAGLTHTKLAVSQTQYRRKVDASGIKGGSRPSNGKTIWTRSGVKYRTDWCTWYPSNWTRSATVGLGTRGPRAFGTLPGSTVTGNWPSPTALRPLRLSTLAARSPCVSIPARSCNVGKFQRI